MSNKQGKTNAVATSAHALTWKARPVFISSTFRDMGAERDWLRTNAFVRLEERLRERCHYLNSIDLRQGVDTASEIDDARREMQVLKVCLQEIERSKPFLVALLGDRYGWIPPPERITAAACEAGLSQTTEIAGKSVTELEILYGVLENPDQRKRSWFYFRTLDTEGMPLEIAAKFPAEDVCEDPDSPAGKLRALKDRIRREMPERVREYTLRWDPEAKALAGIEDLDQMVERDLWPDLDGDTAAYLRTAPTTWEEADSRAIADFVAERTRGYLERPAVTDPMMKHALGEDAGRGLVVTGESGSGKSSLFGRVYQCLQPRVGSEEIVLLAHAAGIFPQSGVVDRMLKRWIAELAAFLGQPNPLADPEESVSGTSDFLLDEKKAVTSEQVDQIFASLLGQASVQKRIVLLVDALNQFENTVRAQHVTWLPRLWPDNARFIATAIPCQATETLKDRRGFLTADVPAITQEEAEGIARIYCRERHHRDINPRVLEVLLSKKSESSLLATEPAYSQPAYANPLWLALALQEMNLLEADDFERAERDYAHLPGAERIQALQLEEARNLPCDVPGAYGELLNRAGRICGEEWAAAFVNLICIGRSGWRESDLHELMPTVSGRPWADLAFAGVRRALGGHVVQRGTHAQWDVFHTTLRTTVLERNLADDSAKRRLHGLIVDHLLSLPPADPLRISETMAHLVGLGDRDRAAEYLASLQEHEDEDPDAKAALLGAVDVVVEAIRSAVDEKAAEQVTTWICSLLDGDDLNRTALIAHIFSIKLNDILFRVGKFSCEESRGRILEAACSSLRKLVTECPGNENWLFSLSSSLNTVGDFLKKRGDLGAAISFYREALAIRENLLGSQIANERLQRGLARSKNNIGLVLKCQGDLSGALAMYNQALEHQRGLVDLDPSNEVFRRNLAISKNNVGATLKAMGKISEALSAHRDSLAIRQQLVFENPSKLSLKRYLVRAYNNYGATLLENGDTAAALDYHLSACKICEELVALLPSSNLYWRELSLCKMHLGNTLYNQGQVNQSLDAYRTALEIRNRLVLMDGTNTGSLFLLAKTLFKIGKVYESLNNRGLASDHFIKAQDLLIRLVEADTSNANWRRFLSDIKQCISQKDG